MYLWKFGINYLTLCVPVTFCLIRDFSICQDDFINNPVDGVLKEHTFTWLAFLQYIHVTTGLPHHSKAPRVTQIHNQFVLGTAVDTLHLPKNYKLGNVVFGDYLRDEDECGLTRQQIKLGIECARAYLEIPLIDIWPHPEYSRFGVGNSLTIVKLVRPLKSHYMVPVCLPNINDRIKRKKRKIVYLVDYISNVPRDFERERLGKKTLKLFTHRECKKHRMRAMLGSEGVTHVLCSSGCGVRSGAPIISHTSDGTYELIGIAAGGAPCTRRGSRRRLNPEPPLYIDVFPYKNWITNVITAHLFPRPYPDNIALAEGSKQGPLLTRNEGYLRMKLKRQKSGWKARTYMTGNFCFRTVRQQSKSVLFYVETFEVNADPPAKLNIWMKVSAGVDCKIICARLMMPNRLSVPVIEGVGGFNITVRFETEWFPYTFYFSLGLHGLNTTQRDFDRWGLDLQKQGYTIT